MVGPVRIRVTHTDLVALLSQRGCSQLEQQGRGSRQGGCAFGSDGDDVPRVQYHAEIIQLGSNSPNEAGLDASSLPHPVFGFDGVPNPLCFS